MLNKKRVIFVKLKSSRQTNLEIKIKGDFTMANTIFPIFLKDSNNRTFDEIQAAHRKNQLFATDSKLNVLLGSVLATDRSELTLTVINMKTFLADLGYDQKSMHLLPSNDKGDIIKKILLSVQHFVAKNFPTRSIKGILFYADEEKPIAHIFFQQKQKPQDSNVPVNTYELTPAKASRSHLNNKKESKPEDPSDLRSNYQQKQKDHDHALRLQHQAMSQQAKATDKEEPSNSRSNYQQKQRDHDHALHLQHQAMNQQAKATDKKEPSNSRSNYQQKQRDHDHALHLQHQAMNQQAKATDKEEPSDSRSNYQQKQRDHDHTLHLQHQAMSQQTKATDKEEEKKSQRHKHQEHHYTYQQPTWWPKDDGFTR